MSVRRASGGRGGGTSERGARRELAPWGGPQEANWAGEQEAREGSAPARETHTTGGPHASACGAPLLQLGSAVRRVGREAIPRPDPSTVPQGFRNSHYIWCAAIAHTTYTVVTKIPKFRRSTAFHGPRGGPPGPGQDSARKPFAGTLANRFTASEKRSVPRPVAWRSRRNFPPHDPGDRPPICGANRHGASAQPPPARIQRRRIDTVPAPRGVRTRLRSLREAARQPARVGECDPPDRRVGLPQVSPPVRGPV